MNAQLTIRTLADRVDRLSPWAFTGAMYLLRWIIVIPIGAALRLAGLTDQQTTFDGSALQLLFGFLFLAPLLETLIECALPYWVLAKIAPIRPSNRPWLFIAVSAALMTLLHISAWPAAILPSLVTGSFLAYTYGHFAPAGAGRALLHTGAFHAAINLVGWSLIMWSRV